MSINLLGAVAFFSTVVLSLIFTIVKTSGLDAITFPRRARFFGGLWLWVAAGAAAVFMAFPGYPLWFVPIVYPLMKLIFLGLFFAGLVLILIGITAFPRYLQQRNQDSDNRSDKLVLLESIRQISAMPLAMTELCGLALKELTTHLQISRGVVFLVNQSRRELYLVAQIGLEKDDLARLERIPLGQDIISRAALEQNAIVSGDLGMADTATRAILLPGHDASLSAAAVPLSSRDRTLGALLVIGDRPYHFEKGDRVLLSAAAETLAGAVESGRLLRENQRLGQLAEQHRQSIDYLRQSLSRLADPTSGPELLASLCRRTVETYGVGACRVIEVVSGDIHDLARYESTPDEGRQSESYRIAIADALKRRRMVVLNQESRNEAGVVYVGRSSLLSPLTVGGEIDAALLIEAPGNALPLTDAFLSDMESMVNLSGAIVSVRQFKESDSLGQLSMQVLADILKLRADLSETALYQRFLEELMRFMPQGAILLAYGRDERQGYRRLHCIPQEGAQIRDTVFLPGEGPIGRAAASGELIEALGRDKVEESWRHLEPGNHDFLRRLCGQLETPGHQIIVPIKHLDTVLAVLALLLPGSTRPLGIANRNLLFIACQLLSIKLSVARLEEVSTDSFSGVASPKLGHLLNRLNNELATVVGRAQLLERQPDISGSTRYTAAEILKAAEGAAAATRVLQSGIGAPVQPEAEDVSAGASLDRFLKKYHVTGNLYMFDDSQTVVLYQEIVEGTEPSLMTPDLTQAMITILTRFVRFIEEGDEVLCRTGTQSGYFYLTIIRGARARIYDFDPVGRDFGDPDVVPADLGGELILPILRRCDATVSFDRFGRRPSYFSMRIPLSRAANGQIDGDSSSRGIPPGLRVLAIDDQQMILDLLSGISQSLGLRLTPVGDPHEGLRLIKSQSFDIVMVDLAMGNISGWEVAAEVKKQDPQIPVILMTGWGINQTPEELAFRGIDFMLAKPFRIEQLTDILAQARHKFQKTDRPA